MKNSLFPTVILAGGLATRLRPLTETIPKSLIDIHGEPFIAHQLRLLRRHHITQVVLCLGYLGEQVQDYVGNGERFDLNVCYSWDGSQLLGTAGSIKKALPLLEDKFFVLYGDSYLLCDYGEAQKAYSTSQKLALMSVFENNGQWDTSNVEFKDNEVLAYDKHHRTNRMKHIDYGLGIFHRQVFDQLPENVPVDLAILYKSMIESQQLAAFEVKQRFYEVGSFSGIESLKHYLIPA